MTKKKRKQKKKLQMLNKRLIKKYYWLMPRDWRGKIPKNYDYTWIEWGWSHGWDKAFGQMYMDELGAAINESGQKDFTILQIKEKYGQARLYCGGASGKVHRIINKYEHISQNVCYWCGREAPMVGKSWITPECFDCYVKRWKRWKPNDDIEVIKKGYDEEVCDEPDENGEFHIPNSYTVSYLKDGGKTQEVIDISDTVEKIRRRQDKWIKYGI